MVALDSLSIIQADFAQMFGIVVSMIVVSSDLVYVCKRHFHRVQRNWERSVEPTILAARLIGAANADHVHVPVSWHLLLSTSFVPHLGNGARLERWDGDTSKNLERGLERCCEEGGR